MEGAGKERKLQLQELEEIRLTAYENSKFYKEKTKKFHDQKLVTKKDFNISQKVLLYKSRVGPMSVEIKEESSDRIFKVNGHRLRIFNENQDMLNKTMDGVNLTTPTLRTYLH
ncbi:uncharacterized protein LOC128194419 [Vigna angularis]|uniref:uncharacterized protein LOC128194419 n=1 Tax=Phaseolus angularis TaxID=3914 RepID=UPI0022B4E4D2|nr:uncharacterized protein LOC128194419 [Vigna angularis]